MRSKSLGPLFLIGLLALAGYAQTEPDNWCRGGFFTKESETFLIGTAIGTRNKRIHFYNDDAADCPNNERCKAKAYVVPGDEVVVSKRKDGFGCAWYQPVKGGGTVGWIRLSELRFRDAVSDVSPREWMGEWLYADNSIKISSDREEGRMRVTGNALWRGRGDNVHIGELDGRTRLQKDVMRYSDGDDEYDCKATLRLVGRFLVVADNLKCGGVNVTFSGVYTKQKK